MVRSVCRASCALPLYSLVFGMCVLGSSARAQHKPAYQLLPANTQAVVWIPDGEDLTVKWDKTQLAKLAKDPSVAPFFEEQRQEIERRFVDAGWRLNFKPEDLANFLRGQIALAWIEVTNPRKPFAMTLIADVDDNKGNNERLLTEIDNELSKRSASKTQLNWSGIDVLKYTLPPRAGELLEQETYYAILQGHFLATDDEALMRQMLARIQGTPVDQPLLADDPVFTEGRKRQGITGEGEIEYFVRPLGFARVLRAIGGKRSKSSSDMLAVLQNQGFASIRCICGEINLGGDTLDMSHRGYVLAERPLPLSAAVLDFPNAADQEVPSFVNEKISSLLVANWNAAEAFWKAEGLVDELAGTPGVFAEIIDGIKRDPNGARIDIREEVLPYFTNDIYSISDSKPGPADVDSRRNLIALKVNNSQAMGRVVDRAMRNEPDAELVEFEGQAIWKVAHPGEDDDLGALGADFGDDFGAPLEDEASDSGQEPWLSDWAIAVYGDYVMFASSVEMIQDAITQTSIGTTSPLVEQPDYKRFMAALADFVGSNEACGWRMVRTDRAYRVQYELFRAGKLKDSQSMLASILDRLLDNQSEIESELPPVSGKTLPPFETISHFLQPSGVMMRSTDQGWSFGGVLLAAPDAQATRLDLSERNDVGTARANGTGPNR